MAAATIIGQGTAVRGNVRGAGSIEIRGRVEGDVQVDGDVAIGEDGAVNGSVSGAQILVAGQVAGDLTGSEAVMLERGARVVGDLVAPRIGIADGALVRGSVRTEGEPTAPRRAAVVPTRRVGESFSGVKAKPALTATPKPATAPAAAKPAPAPPPAQVSVPIAAADPPAGPPAPVVPALGKGVRGKKKAKRS
ncbi:MAG: polymer-forming cytoskeletal protein [Polyangiaceae bacterium]|nr:polymer-forming cytoskeletal protein [Polyangiaceae bacterium]MCL4750334.1 polymer-forming cytoskeletal protein [Myxococcales bacterium]